MRTRGSFCSKFENNPSISRRIQSQIFN